VEGVNKVSLKLVVAKDKGDDRHSRVDLEKGVEVGEKWLPGGARGGTCCRYVGGGAGGPPAKRGKSSPSLARGRGMMPNETLGNGKKKTGWIREGLRPWW